MIERHRGLAVTIARAFGNSSEPFDDRLQVACVGLVKAAERFDVTRSVPFAAWASLVMRGELRRYFRDNCWAVRVPRRLKDLAPGVRRTAATVAARDHHTATAADVALELGVTVDDVRQVQLAAANFRARPLQNERRLGADERAQQAFAHVLADARFAQMVSACPPRLQRVVRMRYVDQLKQSEIGARIGVSQVQVCRLLNSAHRRIRATIAVTTVHVPSDVGGGGSPAT